MSMITCCPSCSTKFKVVADQLRISDGWVRCGRCQEVFDAALALQTAAPAAGTVPAAAVNEANLPGQVLAGAVNTPSASQVADAATNEVTPKSGFQPAALPDPRVSGLLAQAQAALAVLDTGTLAEHAVPAAAQAGYELPAPPLNDDEDDPLLTETLQVNAAVLDSGADAAEAANVEVAAQPLVKALDTPALSDAEAWLNVPWPPQAALPTEETQALMWAQSIAPKLPAPSSVMAESGDIVDAPPDAASADALTPPHSLAADEPPAEGENAVFTAANTAPMHAADVPLEAGAAQEAIPSFVKAAQRKAWWSQPGVRFVMGMLVILLPVALLLQIALHERNTLVAWKPQWRPAFASMCVALQCELAPRQHIASVALTGSAFEQDTQALHYRLSLSVQNKAITAVATPAVELTLTDAQDQVLVRKVLRPADIGAPLELAARSEWSGTLPVATEGLNLPVAGYRVMAFYP